MDLKTQTVIVLLAVSAVFMSCNDKTKVVTRTEDFNKEATATTEVAEATNNRLIRFDGIENFQIGNLLQKDSENLVSFVKKTGEGNFNAIRAIDEKRKEIAILHLDTNDRIKLIEVTDSRYKTDKGIGIGNTFEQIKVAYPDSETHGSEIEGRTTVSVRGMSFLLDAYFNTYKINEKQIKPSTKIKEVVIKGDTQAITIAKTSPKKYICFTNDKNSNQKLWLGLDDTGKAVVIKYKGPQESKELNFTKVTSVSGGSQPTIIEHYDEIYEQKINGQYILKKSGNWYYLNYIRGKDRKEFNFTIDHTAENITSRPCFD